LHHDFLGMSHHMNRLKHSLNLYSPVKPYLLSVMAV
jgi:hypothetical protein